MTSIYIDPLTDFGFKLLFGTEQNKDLLLALLNALLPAGHRLRSIEFSNPEWVGTSSGERGAFFDLYCISERGYRVIVEIQRARQRFFKDRCFYYSTFPVQEQATKGDWDFNLTPVYVIALLDFDFYPENRERKLAESPRYLHVVQLKDQEGEVFYPKYMQVYVELPRFRKTASDLDTEADKWLFFLRHAAELDERPSGLAGEMFDKAFNTALYAKLPPAERKIYEHSMKHDRDMRNAFVTAEEDGEARGLERGLTRGIQEGHARGHAEGHAKGHAKGHAEGHAEGDAKGDRRRAEQAALNAYDLGLDLPTCSKISGLTVAEIEELITRRDRGELAWD